MVTCRQPPLFEGPFYPTKTTRHNIGDVAFSWGEVDHNVYHSHCPPNESKSDLLSCATFPQVYNSTQPPSGKSKAPSLSSFKKWQASGHDTHSKQADPMFVVTTQAIRRLQCS